MEKSYSASYAAAGVDITAGYRSVELMKQYVARTMTESCIGGLGGFGGLFELDCTGMEHPVLISGTDGVGTKLRIAMLLDKHDTIGIDCQAAGFPRLHRLRQEHPGENCRDRQGCGRGLRPGGLLPRGRRDRRAPRHDARG